MSAGLNHSVPSKEGYEIMNYLKAAVSAVLKVSSKIVSCSADVICVNCSNSHFYHHCMCLYIR